jgi:hypothetical protein
VKNFSVYFLLAADVDDADTDDANDSDFEKIMEKIFEDVELGDTGKKLIIDSIKIK